jgi:hypothetical protein
MAKSISPRQKNNAVSLLVVLRTWYWINCLNPSQPGLYVPGGTLVRMMDFAPGAESPMHRAMSLDYGTVIEGEFEVELDSGEKRTMRRGDVQVQRATAHRWRNLSPDKPGRFLCFWIAKANSLVCLLACCLICQEHACDY